MPAAQAAATDRPTPPHCPPLPRPLIAWGNHDTKGRFSIGDEVCLRGIVRQIDLAGTNTVIIELRLTGHLVTVSPTALSSRS